MGLTDDYGFDLLQNEAELLVFNELKKQLNGNEEEFCRCKECLVDMAAIALNAVKPIYRCSLLGAQYAAQAINDPAYAKSVQHAVTAAIEKVSTNPAHD